jgi:hypothetical protein
MTLTDENELELVCQITQHAMLIPWGRFSRYLQLSQRLRTAVAVKRHKDATPGGDLLLEFGLASLAGYEYLRDLNLGTHPLAKDQAVADAWDIEFGYYTTISRFLYELNEAVVERVEAELEAIMRPYLHQAVHEVLCYQEYLTLCGDLTGRPVSSYSCSYPPDAVFGYMANQLRKGHQAALVTLKGQRYRIHIAAFHHAGDTVSSACLRQMVQEAEARLGCRPRRRVELVKQRLEALEAKIAQRQAWCHVQQVIIRQQIDRQIRVSNRIQALKAEIATLEARKQGKLIRPHSRLSQLRHQKANQERQLQAALRQEGQARQVLHRHHQRLDTLRAERETLLRWLAQLELDNATLPHPVRVRWLLDGGFGDVANTAYLIEMGYDFYTIAHGGKTTSALLKQVTAEAGWTQVGSRTYALDMGQQQFGQSPYPLRLTLLRWRADDTLKHTTLLSFSETEVLPVAELFPTYHQRQDVEAAIKQGKSTFGWTKLRVRSTAGIRLLGQFALVFWPNFVRWAADWLADHVQGDTDRFLPVLQQIRPQVRVAANTPAVVLTNPDGQFLQFDPDGPFANVSICLDGPFAYQFPMPLFQSWQQLWPISSVSVKEQLATLVTNENSHALLGVPIISRDCGQPENLVNF